MKATMMGATDVLARGLVVAALATIALTTGVAAAQSFKEYPVPTATSRPWGITAGPDGNLWFTQQYAIGKMTTTGTFTV